MDDCIFCKIGNGKIPSHKVLETKTSFGFLDIHPHAKGHTVVIPKTHAVRIFDMSEKQVQEFMLDVTKTMKRIQDVLDPDGFNVGWNHNTAGGQVVPHLHVHIFPRYTNDGGGSMHSIIDNSGKINVEEVAKKFRWLLFRGLYKCLYSLERYWDYG